MQQPSFANLVKLKSTRAAGTAGSGGAGGGAGSGAGAGAGEDAAPDEALNGTASSKPLPLLEVMYETHAPDIPLMHEHSLSGKATARTLHTFDLDTVATADASLALRMSPLEIVYSPKCVARV